MGFADIVGHHKQIETLRQSLKQGRLHHAYLFVGPEGVGKKTLAVALAQALHCERVKEDFCGQCGNCIAIQKSNHPDVRFVEPLAGKKEISIQQVRDIEKELAFHSFSGGKKIAVIDSATLMNWSAQNALLKTLEEPPHNSLLILIAAQCGGLLPTVRSRCLRVSFASLLKQAVAGFLMSQKGKTEAEAQFLAALSHGSLGAVQNIEAEGLLDKRAAWIATLLSLTPRNYRAALEAAEVLARSREDALGFLQWTGSWYRDVLVHAVSQGGSNEVVNIDIVPQIQQLSTQATVDSLLTLLAKTTAASGRIQRNVNRRMVIEELFLRVVERRSWTKESI